MATAEELLAMALGGDSEVLVVDNDLRTINIPDTVKYIGVESDDAVLRLSFLMPRYYDDVDLSEFNPKINYLNAKGDGGVYYIDDAVINEDNIAFTWLVQRYTVAYKGSVTFNICLTKIDDNSVIIQEFNTTPTTLPVLAGLETTEQVVEEHIDILEEWKKVLFAADTVAIIEEAKASAVADMEVVVADVGTAIDEKVAAAGTAIDEKVVDTEATVDNYLRSITDEGATQIGLVQAEGTAQIEAVAAEGASQIQAIQVKGEAQTLAVKTEGDAQILSVQTEGSEQISALQTEGASQVGLVQTEGASQITALQTEGTTQVGLVQTEGATQTSSLQTFADETMTEINAAKDEANAALTKVVEAETKIDEALVLIDTVETKAEEALAAVETIETKTNESLASIEEKTTEATTTIDAKVTEVETKTTEVVTTIETKAEETLTQIETSATHVADGKYANSITDSASGTSLIFTDSAEGMGIPTLRIFGKSTQAAEPTPDTPQDIVNIGADGEIVISVTNGGDVTQTLVCPVEGGLAGVPVDSDGNYTDADGQQWACDEIDFGRGVYIQRCFAETVRPVSYSTSSDNNYYACEIAHEPSDHLLDGGRPVICKELFYNARTGGADMENGIKLHALDKYKTTLCSRYNDLDLTTIDLRILYILKTPIEMPLSDELLTAYRQMTTSYPTTSVTTDADAYMEAEYCVDTKTYIDNNRVVYSETANDAGGTTVTIS